MEKRREAIKRRWEEKRFQAAVWRDYQLETAQRLYEAEVETVEREFEEERGRLKEKLIMELLEERKRLMDELEPTLSAGGALLEVGSVGVMGGNGSGAGGAASSKRSLRKRANEDQSTNNPSALAAAGIVGNINMTSGNGNLNSGSLKTLSGRDTQRRRTGASGNPYDQLGRMGIETRLAEEDMMEDVRMICKEPAVVATTSSGRRTANGSTANNNGSNINNNSNAQKEQHSATISSQTLPPTNNSQPPQSPERKRTKPHTGPKGPTAVINGLHDTLIDAQVTSSTDAILQYNQLHVFQRGDPVVVLVTQSDSTFTGTISTIGQNELWIRREDGTKNKIYLGQLRIGKYKLAPPNQPFP